jgi:hypothetical protein
MIFMPAKAAFWLPGVQTKAVAMHWGVCLPVAMLWRGRFRPRWMRMDQRNAAFWMSIVGVACWGICFWWMGRISAKQNRLMDQLREQGRRIEKLSKVEHDLIKEVHPQVGEIKEGMDEMIAAVKENTANQTLAAKRK